jgi:uncharacterized protein (PEP-CTERM system associated)
MSAMAMALNSEATPRKSVFTLIKVGVGVCLTLQSTWGVFAQNLPGQAEIVDPANNPLTKLGVTTLPGVRTSITYSNNLSLQPRDLAQAGFRLEVSPYILAAANTPSAQGYVYYAMRNFYRTAGPNGAEFDSPKHDFRSNGKIQLINEFLYLKGSAYTFNVNSINFSPTSFDPATVITRSSSIQGVNLSPYIQSRFGNFADYSLGYSYGQTSISGANLVSRDNRFTGSAASGSEFNRWGWSWNGENQERSFNGQRFLRNSSTGIAYWIPTENLKIGASIRYSQIDGFVNQKGKDNGYGPGFAIDYAPSARTKLKLTGSAEYFGNTGDMTFVHESGRLSVVGGYEKSVLSSNDATLLNQNPSFLGSSAANEGGLSPAFRNFVSNSLYAKYGVLTGVGLVDSAYVSRSGGKLAISYKLSPLSTASLSYFNFTSSTRTQTVNPSFGGTSVLAASLPVAGTFYGTLHTEAVSLNVIVGLDATSKLSFTLDALDNNFVSILRRFKVASFATTYSTKVSPSSTASFGLRHTELIGTGYQANSYSENAVFGAIDMRF